MTFREQFVHGQLYLLPDGTEVRALLYDMECLQTEWVFENLAGVRKFGVLPDGRVVAYVPAGRDYFGPVYQFGSSDLTVDDLRPA